MDNVTVSTAPVDPNQHLIQSQCAGSEEAIGSLLWLALGTRLDLSYAVGQVTKFNADPGQAHWNTVPKIYEIIYRSSVDCVDTQVVMLGSPILSG